MRQLQYCVTERAALDCVELFANEQRRGNTGGFCRDAYKTFDREMSYQRKAENMMNDENCFKVYIVSVLVLCPSSLLPDMVLITPPILQYKIDCRVTIELLDSEPEEVEKPAVLKAQKFSKYVERLANPSLGAGGGGGGPGGNGSGGNNNNENTVESSDIKTEEEEDNAEVSVRKRRRHF